MKRSFVGRTQRDVDPATIFAKANSFIMVNVFTAPDAGENFRFFVVALSGNEKRDLLADNFVGCVAEQPFGASIPTRNDAIEILA